MTLAISKQLPRGVMLTKLKDPAWRKEGFLLINVIRGATMLYATWQPGRLWACMLADGQPSCTRYGADKIMCSSTNCHIGRAVLAHG